jgi:hypothetical protein
MAILEMGNAIVSSRVRAAGRHICSCLEHGKLPADAKTILARSGK